MDIFDLFSKDACSLGGKGSLAWTWKEYHKKKGDDNVVLVDMINHPVPGSVPISNELFDGSYRDLLCFVLSFGRFFRVFAEEIDSSVSSISFCEYEWWDWGV